MTQPRIRTRKQALRKAFIATVAAASVTAVAGCFGVTTNNPPFPGESCPEAMPDAGESCFETGLSCEYPDFCGVPVSATCHDGAWQVDALVGTCNPPPPGHCPDAQPTPGEICPEIGMNCHYTDEFCGVEIEARCDAQQVWDVDQIACNPPPAECPLETPTVGTVCEPQTDTIEQYPSWCAYDAETPCGTEEQVLGCVYDDLTQETTWQLQQAPTCQAQPEQCQSYGASSLCEADPGCSWQLPGCGDPNGAPEVTAGCYPSADCTATGCGDWGTCTKVTVDPCWDSLCDACASEANVCVPN